MKVFEIQLVLFLMVYVIIGSTIEQGDISEDLVLILYLKYKEALGNDVDRSSLRRTVKHNKYKEYKVHVKKLKEVNGFKTHNLLIKKEVKGDPDNPIIYINNPVETKIPNAYLTMEEFKKVLTDRVNRQRFPSKTEHKHYKKYLNNETRTTVTNNMKKYTTKLVAHKEIITKKPVKSVTITNKKTTNAATKNVTGNFKNKINLTTKALLQIQTKPSKPIITMVKQSNEINSELNSSVTEIRAIFDKEDVKSKTTNKGVLRSNNTSLKYIRESSLFNTIEMSNKEVTDTDTDIINSSTIIANTRFLEEDKPEISNITNEVELMVTKKEVSTTTSRTLTRSKLSRPLVFMGGFT